VRSLQSFKFRTTARPNEAVGLSDNLISIFDSFLDTKETGISQVAVTWPERLESITLLSALAQIEHLLNRPGTGIEPVLPMKTLIWPWARSGKSLQNRVLCDRNTIVKSNSVHLNHLFETGQLNGGEFRLYQTLSQIQHLDPNSNYAKSKSREIEQVFRHPSLSELTPTILIKKDTNKNSLQVDYNVAERYLSRVKKYTLLAKKGAGTAQFESDFDIEENPSLVIGCEIGIEPSLLCELSELKKNRPNIILLEGYLLESRLGDKWTEKVYDFVRSMKDLYQDHEEGLPPIFIVTDNLVAARRFHDHILPFYESRKRNTENYYLPHINFSKDIFEQQKMFSCHNLNIEFEFNLFAKNYVNTILEGEALASRTWRKGDHEIARSIRKLIQSWRWYMVMPYGIDAYQAYLLSSEGIAREVMVEAGATPFHYVTQIRRLLNAGEVFTDKTEIINYVEEVQAVIKSLKSETPFFRFLNSMSSQANNEKESFIVLPNSEMSDFANWLQDNHADWRELKDKLLKKKFSFINANQLQELFTDKKDDVNIYWISPRITDLVNLIARGGASIKLSLVSEIGKLGEIYRAFKRVSIIYKKHKNASGFLLFFDAINSFLKSNEISDMPIMPSMSDKYYPKNQINQHRFEGTDFDFKIILSREKKELLCYKGSQLLKFNGDNELKPFSITEAKSIKRGDHICFIDDDFFEEVRNNFCMVASASKMLRAYHIAVSDAFESFPGVNVKEKVDYLRAKIMQYVSDPKDVPAPNSVKRWVDVRCLIDTPLEKVTSHAPRSWPLFKAFMQALDFDETFIQMCWTQGVQKTRGDRIVLGNFSHSFFLNAIVNPCSYIEEHPERKEYIEGLVEEAHRSVSTVKIVEEIS